jgi:hypothetical protein
MKNKIIKPIGLKGNEINERMKQLMGVRPINEGLSRYTVELTKIGPDGKAYGVVRENHEYYIKVSDKTTNLTVEDFKYIGGLQNKKLEAYPSYAKATKHLNLRFNSICESFDIVNTFNVFVDDNLLSEGAAKEAGKHITDAKGKTLEAKAKEEGGDNVAEKKVMDEMEEVTLTEDELAIDAMLNEVEEELDENQSEIAIKAYNKLNKKDKEEKEEEEEDEEDDEPFTGKYVSKRDIEEGKSKNNPWAICTDSVGREDKEKYEACVRKVKKEKGIKEELKGNQSKIDANKNGKIDGEDFKILKKKKTNENFGKEDMSTDELMDKLDNMSAKELLQLLGDAGRDLKSVIARKLSTGIDKARDYFDKQYPDVEEGKSFPDLTGDGKVTRADILKGRGVDLDEEMSLEEIQEAIADLKKKL